MSGCQGPKPSTIATSADGLEWQSRETSLYGPYELTDVVWAGTQYVAGVDEVGRGCLAGPVVAAAVILHPERAIEGLVSRLIGRAIALRVH